MIKKQAKNGNLFLLITLLMMVILFFSSSQTYEEQSSVSFLKQVLASEPFKKQLSGISFSYGGSEVSIEASGYIKFVEFFIRKAAHFFTYFILAGSLYLGLKPRCTPFWLAGIVSWMSATGYAATDEFHQMLTGGRTPLFQDVMLDSIGGLTACVLIFIFYTLKIGIKK